VEVRLRLQYVEKYKQPQAFTCISEGDKGELLQYIAPLVHMDDTDELAKRFDNFMYGLMLASLEQMPSFAHAKQQLRAIATELEKKISIPQVKEKLPLIKEVNTDAFWDANDVLLLEKARTELRALIKFLDIGGPIKDPIITHLDDPVIEQQEGVELPPAYDFEDYRAKVNRYINEHGDAISIFKLTHNIPLTVADYQELERVLTNELGSKSDYEREFGDTPFGLLIRKIAKLDHEAAMNAFSAFINDQSLNSAQIAFVHKIIHYIEQNGYMENATALQKPPFDKPTSFVKLFDAKTRVALVDAIRKVKENAVIVAA
jgi:type I restriction enzyme R subunit